MTIKDILYRYGLNYEQASEITGIPARTIQNWCLDYREPAPYMAGLMDAKISLYCQDVNYKKYLQERFG